MNSQAGHSVAKEPVPPARDTASDYQRLVATLTSRAKWLGSRDPESAAQETLKRSLENSISQSAVQFYFAAELPTGAEPPAWPLDQLFAWLHAVLRNVIREEQSRASYRREVPLGIDAPNANMCPDPADPAPNPLDILMDKEIQGIVTESFAKLDREYRRVLRMRVDGLKYGEIARRLGVNENTVATWVSRGIRDLAQSIRKRVGEAR
jgi:RNA polymerase sigma factor (sigma-70 family)